MRFDSINNEIKKFVDERDWGKFHTPKTPLATSGVQGNNMQRKNSTSREM